MGHPFTNSEAKGFRDRVVKFVHSGLHRTLATNILFVCGGEENDHLRPQFIDFMDQNLPEYIAFKPEIAQADYFANDQLGGLNLSDFEELISDLSLGIILFAESPGSYAELGLFSALDNARKKTLVILNVEKQGKGSFLSMGPTATIEKNSRLGRSIQLDYKKPDFNLIKDRVQSQLKIPSGYRSIGEKDYSQLTPLEVLSLVWFFADFLGVSSVEDIIFCMKSAFRGHASGIDIKQIISVLVGANILVRIDPIGLLRVNSDKPNLAEPLKTKRRLYDDLNVEMLALTDAIKDGHYQEAFENVD